MDTKTLNEMFDMPKPDIEANIPVMEQVALWATGVAVHNSETGQHCPDFSCCIPELASPLASRLRFKQAVADGRMLLASGLMKEYMTKLHAHYGINVIFMDIANVYGCVLN